MKLPLHDVLGIGNCMKRMEDAGLALAPAQQLLWAITRKRVWEFVDQFNEGVFKEYRGLAPAQQTQEKLDEIQNRHLQAVNGNEVEVNLPARIKTSAIKELQCRKTEDYQALGFLEGKVFEVDA